MKGQFVKVAAACAIIASVNTAQADSREVCDAYRMEIISLRAALDSKYGEQRVLLRGHECRPN